MRIVRERAGTPADDRAITEALLEHTRERGEPGLRVWYPPRQVAFGRRDRRAPGYERARERAAERGFPPVTRRVGGRAVALSPATLSVVLTAPGDGDRGGIPQRYARVREAIAAACRDLGVDVTEGEPAGAFCPGTHALRADGKLAGLAQRVRRDVVAVGGVVVVAEAAALSSVLEPVYGALEVPFDPEAVGSLAAAGCGADRARVRSVLEDRLARTWRAVRET